MPSNYATQRPISGGIPPLRGRVTGRRFWPNVLPGHGPPGSLRVQANSSSEWFLQTAVNSLLQNSTTYSVCFAVRLNATTTSSCDIITARNIEIVFGLPTSYFRAYGANLTASYIWTPTVGQTYFIVVSYTPTGVTWYSQAQVVATSGPPGAPRNNLAGPINVGYYNAFQTPDYSLNQLAIWQGYALTQADALALRGGALPTSISPGNIAAYWTFDGTLGANPQIGDAELNDASGNGHNFTTLTGPSSLATYGGPLVYSPSTLITPYISKSGQTAYFLSLSNTSPPVLQTVTNVNGSPTISVQFGGSGPFKAVQAQGPYWLPNVPPQIPFITYQLSCGPVQSVVIQNGGSGYALPLTASVSGGGGSGCTLGIPVLTGGAITSIAVTTPGSGYTSPPEIVISGYFGSGASAVAVMGGVQPADVVTYSAADSWIIAASGPAPAAPSAYTTTSVANYAGELEPALGGYLPFDLPANQRTMPVGPQLAWPSSQYYMNYNACTNWIHRTQNPWTNAVTSTPDGHPITITGTASSVFDQPSTATGIDGHGYPNETGVWTFIADDTNPSNPMQAGLTSSQYNATISPSGLGAPVYGGTLIGGLQVGRVWQWTVTRSSTTEWCQGLTINVGIPGAAGTYNYTLQNEALFSPLTTAAASPAYPSRANLLGPDQAIINWMTTPSGRYPASMRFVEATTGIGGQAPIVDADDLLSPTDFIWSGRQYQTVIPTGTRAINVTTIRTYALSTSGWPAEFGTITWSSPYVYLSAWNNPAGQAISSVRINNGGSGYTAPIASLSGGGGSGCTLGIPVLTGGAITSIPVTTAGSGYTTPPSITITDSTGSGAIAMPVAALEPPSESFGWDSSDWYVGEAVTSAPHNLKSGQMLYNITGSGTYAVSNGASAASTGQTLVGGIDYVIVWVTSPTTFAFYSYDGNLTYGSGASIPGGCNNVIGSNTVSYTLTLSVPQPGTIPYECAAQIAGTLPGCGIHVNTPFPATDACVAAIAQKVRDNFPPGRNVFVEFTVENWNFTPQQLYTLGSGALGAWGSGGAANYTASYAIRAAQHHQTFIAVFNQTDIHGNTNRGGEIVRCFGSQLGNAGVTGTIITAVNTYNAGSPAAPIQIDRILVAPYVDMPSSSWPNPSVAATVNPTGGGTTGGLLGAGLYYLTYTWIDSLSGMETAVGQNSAGGLLESARFTVASGDIPQATIPALPAWAASASIYLTAAGGASGSEVRYLTGVTTTTVNLAVANTGSVSPPSISRLPSIQLAAASLASGHATSIAYGWPTPWTRPALLDFYRHWIKYTTYYNGPAGTFASQQAAIAFYNLVGGQSTPTLMTYEGAIEDIIPGGVETGPDGSGYYLRNQLSHDVYYDPEIYYCEMALMQMCQQAGVVLYQPYSMCMPLTGVGGTDGGDSALWGLTTWAGQPAGRGDGSGTTTVGTVGPTDGVNPAGTAITNKFWIDTGSAQHLANASPRMQAARDWIDATGSASFTPLSWTPKARPLTGPMHCSRYG